MDITPPTDNLYKFIAVGGLVLFGVCLIVPWVVFRDTGMEFLAQHGGQNELKVLQEYTKARSQTLELRKNELQKRLDKLKSASNPAEVDKLEGQIKEASREVESIEDASYELNFNLALKEAQIQNEKTINVNHSIDSRQFLWVGWSVALVSFVFSILGFVFWYRRFQRYQDLKVASEAEEAKAKLGALTKVNTKIKYEQPIQPTPTPVTQVDLPQPTQ
jgi:TolA-binding protein